MATLVERLAIQALKTFSRKKPLSPQCFQANFSALKALADQVTAEDVKLDEALANYEKKKSFLRSEAPVTYIEIFENEDITIGIFVLKPNARIPLHDHPRMNGILKVILGSVRVQSYTILPDDLQDRIPDCIKKGVGESGEKIFSRSLKKQTIVIAEKLQEAVISSNSGACVLSPSEKNLHDIRSVDGPAAFLDVLAPPYNSDNPNDEARECHYYTEAPKITSVSEEAKGDGNQVWLLQIPSPSEFKCDTATYRGPVINLP
ncbi:hypothetical protein J437_LFUL011342 [Ladona fulva]|uniref:2-aminoethanethiol dioxygenase n=1 Tax=Ladona fulva TaxID=123851 RepID=A0A8K0P4N2_LADFU|nr:hypothetical protein J437_LFUL011342 [Ladona fulva]